MEPTTECRRCSRNRNNEVELPLKLPNDLTPYTKIVLNKIYKKFRNDMQEYEDTVRIFTLKQKAEMKHYIECLVSNTSSEPPVSNDEPGTNVLGEPENTTNEQQPETEVPSENSRPSEITNHNSSNYNTKCCPQIQPDIRQQFTNNIRELNHILESLLCRRECNKERSTRDIKHDDTLYRAIQHNLVTSSCPHRSRSLSKKRT